MTFTISPAIKQCWPETALGLLLYQVQVAPSSPQLLAQFDQTVASLAQQYTLDTIAKHPHIAATRQAYKALGASPHEHRNAAEAMLRRVTPFRFRPSRGRPSSRSREVTSWLTPEGV